MSAAVALGILAIALQGSDTPQLPTNVVPERVAAVVQAYMPDGVYAGATATGEAITYVGGADWQTGRKWGVGVEYRQWRDSVSFARKPHQVVTHVAVPYTYRELPPMGSLVIRTEIGAGVLWAESSDMEASSTWVASVRGSGRVVLSERIDAVVWVGAVYVASTRIRAGGISARTKASDWPEAGLALRIRL